MYEMEEKMTQYLKSIGITEVIEKRVNELLTQVENLTKEKAVDILVNEYVNEEGMKIYEHLRVWTDNYKMIIPNFLTESQFNISPIDEYLSMIKVTARDFDFITPSTTSRIFIEGRPIQPDVHIRMKGSGTNCKHVIEMFRKYFVPYGKKRNAI